MTENKTLDTIHDDDLADEALDRTAGGKICAGGSLQCQGCCVLRPE